jgi:hypothetical protein
MDIIQNEKKNDKKIKQRNIEKIENIDKIEKSLIKIKKYSNILDPLSVIIKLSIYRKINCNAI